MADSFTPAMAASAAPSNIPASPPPPESSSVNTNEEGFENEIPDGQGGAAAGAVAGAGSGGGGGPQREEDGEGGELSLTELLYSASSYHAIAKPVTVTMILAALATVFINTPETMAEYGQGMADAYQVFTLDPAADGTGETLGKSAANALIIVSVIGGMTFVIVLLYKYRCMKCLIGYMVFSSATLLGLLGGVMFDVAINKYSLPISVPTFYLTLWNFAVVGVVAIFYQKGIPTIVNQSYLIATSVILSWQLSHFDEWTAWTLLAMLALYDLCAVLTPCGPLKLLVNLMQEDDSPDMPGLLYEAELPEGARRPGAAQSAHSSQQGSSRQRRTMSGMTSGGNRSGSGSQPGSRSASASRHSSGTGESNDAAETSSAGASAAQQRDEEDPDEEEEEATVTTPLTPSTSPRTPPRSSARRAKPSSSSSSRQSSGGGGVEMLSAPLAPALPGSPPAVAPTFGGTPAPDAGASANTAATSAATGADGGAPPRPPTGLLPLAIAKIYRLPLVDPSSAPEPRREPSTTVAPLLQNDATADAQEDQGSGPPPSTPNASLARQYTPEELRAEVEVVFPENGGRIVARPHRDGQTRYVVLSREGEERRVLLVDEQGKVLEELERRSGRVRDWDEGSEYEESANSIKLGLGDFIFYSVLVGKAALYSFATFAACTLVILAGLGGTLVLLAVWKQALPALPISIFLGVLFYILTRIVVEPWIEDVMRTPLYV